MPVRCPNPSCKRASSKIIDGGREDSDASFMWRRRECLRCKQRFNTREFTETKTLLKGKELQNLKGKLRRVDKLIAEVRAMLKDQRV